MKIFVFLFIFAVAAADEQSDCKCQKGYYAQKDESGVVSCYGSILKSNEKSILPCNILVKPTCQCSDAATSVIQDRTGTWCGKILEGKEDKRWPCENKNEWEVFYTAHPEEKPTTQLEEKEPTQTEEKEAVVEEAQIKDVSESEENEKVEEKEPTAVESEGKPSVVTEDELSLQAKKIGIRK